jgi:hypothetical protein
MYNITKYSVWNLSQTGYKIPGLAAVNHIVHFRVMITYSGKHRAYWTAQRHNPEQAIRIILRHPKPRHIFSVYYTE